MAVACVRTGEKQGGACGLHINSKELFPWIWRPPLHFMPVSPRNGAPVTFDDAVKEAVRRKMKVTPDMGNLLRVCFRLEGGGRDANLKQMSVALGVDPSGKSKYLIQIAIELRLQALGFRDREDFTPTTTQMDLSGAAFDMAMRVRELLPRYPGKWETVGYSIQDLCRRLVYFSDHGAFN